MSVKDTVIGIGVVLAIAGAIIYANHKDASPESQLGRALYINGPNAGSEECRKLIQELGSTLDRQVNEDIQAENRDTAEFERIMRSEMAETERQIAINNLSAKEDIAK